MAVGMMGFRVTHPTDLARFAVDRAFAFRLSAHDVKPGSYTPKVNTMLDQKLRTFNSRVFPSIDSLPVC